MAMFGMRGTGSWVPNQRPLNWREMILKLYPNGMAPLTAMLSKMSSVKVDDPAFNWWTQVMSTVQGPVTATSLLDGALKGTSGTVTLPTRSDAPVPGPMPEEALGGVTSPNRIAGAAAVAAATGQPAFRMDSYSNSIRVGHQIMLLNTAQAPWSLNCKVTAVAPQTNGTTILTVETLETSQAVGGADAEDTNYFKIIGNINAEGSEMPDPITLDPMQVWSYTQIFRTSLSITRTARKTRIRTEDQYQKMKSEALEMHSWEMEMAFLFGQLSMKIASNGHPERTTRGFTSFIKTYAPNNVFDYLGLNPPGVTAFGPWSGQINNIANGQRWLDEAFEQIFRYGAQEKLMLCGSGAVMGINRLAASQGAINIAPKETTWGLDVHKWVTPFGVINFMTHPLMSLDPVLRNTGLLMEPREIIYRFIDDTTFFSESGKTRAEGTGHNRVDATKEEFLTEAGLEFGLPQKCGIFYNIGLDRP